MIVLGIETSCDETAASVVRGEGDDIEVLSNIVASQINIHRKYGGVVPEVAAREHVIKIIPVIDKALRKAGVIQPPLPKEAGIYSNRLKLICHPRAGGDPKKFDADNTFQRMDSRFHGNDKNKSQGTVEKKLDAIGVTVGPGLVTSLIVGVETAKALAFAWNLPLVAINHIEGHIYANFIRLRQKSKGKSQKAFININSNIQFPAIILTVSGGHTMLVLMEGHGKLKVVGDTLDDAAGEAFDKAAAMLGLGYPGGPVIAAAAAKFPISNFQFPNKSKTSNPKLKIKLPRPMINSKDFNFSFSGLKTALLYDIKKNPLSASSRQANSLISNYAHEFQQAAIDVLISKTIKAAKYYNVKTIMLAGGVSASLELRKQMASAVDSQIPDPQFLIPDLKYTTDNAAMIATAGYYKILRKQFTPIEKVKADCGIGL
jgi:N6-L-threonylcarbamoyladenine synthase